MSLSINDILNNLVADVKEGKIDKGTGKKKREPKVGDEEKRTYRLTESRLKSKRILMPITVVTCKCGSVHSTSNAYPLVERTDKHGNRHISRFITEDDIKNLPRDFEYNEFSVDVCEDCFMDAELVTNVTEEARDDVSVESALSQDEIDSIDAIINKMEI